MRVILPVVIVCVATVLVVRFHRQGKRESQPTITNLEGEIVPLKVVGTVAKISDLRKRVTASGTVKAKMEIKILSEIQGKIDKILVREGDFVPKGKLLVKFESTEEEISEKEAKLRLTQKQKDFEILKKTNPQLDSGTLELRSGLLAAKIEYERAKASLMHTRIYAPFSGVVGNIMVQPYETVEFGAPILTIAALDTLKVETHVLESKLPGIKKGRDVKIISKAYSDKVYSGWVESVSPFIDPNTQSFRVIVSFNNPHDGIIRPGMSVTLKITNAIYENRLIVPKEAVLTRGGRTLVFVAKAGKAKWCYVELGEEGEHFVEIKNGIDSGDTVLIKGHYTLAHDTPIEVEVMP